MYILLSALSIVCSYLSKEEYWNIINLIPALFILMTILINNTSRKILYVLPAIILSFKDIIWWITNVGINFPRLAVIMAISGILKMIFDVIIIILCFLYAFQIRTKFNIITSQIVFMGLRIIMFIIPVVVYHNTFDNIYIEYISICSYALIYASQVWLLISKDKEIDG